jgi:hypothetical protein
LVACVDGKPLSVGGSRPRPGAGCTAKGYKLHAIWAGHVLPEAWTATVLNGNEKTAAVKRLKL